MTSQRPGVGFLNLSRELRDMIYDCANESREHEYPHLLTATVTNVHCVGLLLACKQINREYKQCLKDQAAIRIDERDWKSSGRFTIPRALTSVKTIELNATVTDALREYWSALCADWVYDLFNQVPHVSDITINVVDLYVEQEADDDELHDDLLRFCEELRHRTHRNTRLRIFGYQRLLDFEGGGRPEVQYRPESGELEAVDSDDSDV